MIEAFSISSPADESSPNDAAPAPERLFEAPARNAEHKLILWYEGTLGAHVVIWFRAPSGAWIELEAAYLAEGPLVAHHSFVRVPAKTVLFAQMLAVMGATAIKGAFV